MKKPLFWLIILFILLTTYFPKFEFATNYKFNIQKIEIDNNFVLESDEIKKKLSFIYNENLFFLNIENIQKNLKDMDFIQSFTVKKIYPSTLKLTIYEKKPIAILQNKKAKYYISDKGDLIRFKKLDIYDDLPIIFGKGNDFYSFYKDLKNIKFPLNGIKSYYFFESGRWDLIMHNNKVIKLPIKNYLFSLKDYMKSMNNKNFNAYKIYDYRIKNQLILN